MKKFTALLILTSLMLAGCGDKPTPEIQANEANLPLGHPDSANVQHMHYADVDRDIYSTAVMDIKSWPAMIAFNNTILKMKDADTIYASYGKQLNQELNAMSTSLPSRLSTPVVKRQLNLLRGQVDDLQQTIVKNPSDRKAVASSAQRFLEEYATFNASVRGILTAKNDSIPEAK